MTSTSFETTDYAVAAVTSSLHDAERERSRQGKTEKLESSFKRRQRALGSQVGKLWNRVGWTMVCTFILVLGLIYVLRPPVLKVQDPLEDIVDQPLSVTRVLGVSVGAAFCAGILKSFYAANS